MVSRGPWMLAGGVEGVSRSDGSPVLKVTPKSYETVLCHPTHIYYAHTMKIQKRDHIIPVSIFSWGKTHSKHRPTYDESPEGISPRKGQE